MNMYMIVQLVIILFGYNTIEYYLIYDIISDGKYLKKIFNVNKCLNQQKKNLLYYDVLMHQ